MNPPGRDTFWPPVLLAMALACVLVFLVLSKRREPTEPLRKPQPGASSATDAARLTIEFLDVGQGDSALIRSPEGKLALVDAGPTNRVVKLLRARGVERLDLVVVSHHHADHYGGMLAVIKEFRPKVFLDAPSPHSSRFYESILREVRDSGMTAIQPSPDAPRHIELGSVILTILPQPPVDPKNENNNSIGLRVSFGDFSALLTGDSEVAERAWWTKHASDLCAEVSVLKLAHHGSRNGTSPAWLRLTKPGLAVASLGEDNDYGHPHPETLQYLAAAGVILDRTDHLGTITIITDGQTWTESDARTEPTPDDSTASPHRFRQPDFKRPLGFVFPWAKFRDGLVTFKGRPATIAFRRTTGPGSWRVDPRGEEVVRPQGRLADRRVTRPPAVTVADQL